MASGRASARSAGRRAVAAALAEAGAGGALTVLLADDAAVKRLNGSHRAKTKPTNVLSFPAGAPGYLGDVAVALGVVRREARGAAGAWPTTWRISSPMGRCTCGPRPPACRRGAADGARRGTDDAPARPAEPLDGRDMSAANGSGHANGHAERDRRNSFFWRLQSLLRGARRRACATAWRSCWKASRATRIRRRRGAEDTSGLDTHERVLLGNVLRLRDKTAYDVMVPRADIAAMPEDLTLEQAIRLIQREGHSRFPVYRGNLDDIVGMVHIKDVFAAVGRDAASLLAEGILRRPLLVVPTCRCSTCCCRCARSASTWRWWWTSTAASTGW